MKPHVSSLTRVCLAAFAARCALRIRPLYHGRRPDVVDDAIDFASDFAAGNSKSFDPSAIEKLRVSYSAKESLGPYSPYEIRRQVFTLVVSTASHAASITLKRKRAAHLADLSYTGSSMAACYAAGRYPDDACHACYCAAAKDVKWLEEISGNVDVSSVPLWPAGWGIKGLLTEPPRC
ncbi:MAG: hypothetical protein QGG36_04340 [Pirellulaceae bacterium]|jgi:hypothetical protein|nr:hypothetical protein [Pirellulaceae bacterium]MDP7014999.1 hypothetical protein [Pirellulaceae bacterium]